MPDPTPTPTPTPTPAPAAITAESIGSVQGDAFRALLPAEIQAKPYAKEINNFGEFVKKFDGAQALLGQRALPDANTPDDKWGEFHTKLRPESADKYTLGQVEGLKPEYIEKSGNIVKVLKNILFANGASAYQAKGIIPGILKELAIAEEGFTKQQEDAFTKMTTDLFGAQKDTVIANGKKFLAAHLPDNVKPLLDGMDEKQLTVLLAATDGIAKKFTGEDPFRGGGAGAGSGGGETQETLVAQMQAIMKEPCWSDPFKDKPKHAQLTQQMEGIRAKLKALQGAGAK